jgi:hypothetical protein
MGETYLNIYTKLAWLGDGMADGVGKPIDLKGRRGCWPSPA